MSKTIIVMHDAKQVKADRKYYKGAIYTTKICNEEKVVWNLARSKDYIITQNQFCLLCRRSRYKESEYKKYLKDYTLIIDGEIDVVEEIPQIYPDDMETFLEYCEFNPATKRYTWKESKKDYHWCGYMGGEKNFADHGGLYSIGNKLSGVIPPWPFTLFKEIVIKGNYLLQRLLDVYGVTYKTMETIPKEYTAMIHIDNEKLKRNKRFKPSEPNRLAADYIQDHGVTVDEDGYALSEMLQWIWRSAIRDGKEIYIYIPSRRMRELLQKWIEDNSPMIIDNSPKAK